MLTIKKYNGDIDWNVGALFSHTIKLLNILNAAKSLNLDTKIRYSFGCFNCKFNSGRPVWGKSPTMDFVSTPVDWYNDIGISARFTFSNNYIEEKDLEDPFINEVLYYINNKNKNNNNLENGVIFVSDILATYIRKNYPYIPLISSLYRVGIDTEFISDTPDYYNALLDKYDVVVVDTNKVRDHDVKFLQAIKDKSRVEFIANNHCRRHCPNVKQHDLAVASMQIAACQNDIKKQVKLQTKINKYMELCHNYYMQDPEHNNLMLTEEEINMCIDMGYTHFKIQGREEPDEIFFGDIAKYIFSNSEIE